jgi:signal peptidase I
MPGVEACGRCGSPVTVKTLDVDVHPPRASERQKRWRRLLPFRSAYYSARDASRRAQQGWFQGVLQIASPNASLGVLARLIVPGWAQLHLGQRALGNAFLFGWLACLFLALLCYGSMLGAIFMGLAFSVHVSSCIAILHMGGVDSRGFWINTVLVFAFLALCVYLPAGWLGSRVASPIHVGEDYPPFTHGDIILYSPVVSWLRAPRPGDVVVYQQHAVNYNLPPPAHTAVHIAAGQRFDRILAGPGDRVFWKDNQLTVNGEPAAYQPLNPKNLQPPNPERSVPELSFTLPAGCYLIFPSVGPQLPGALDARGWRELSVVPAESIVGRVIIRSYPFTRFGRIS